MSEDHKYWFDKWSSCEPLNHKLVEQAITELYSKIKLSKPEFVWVNSPTEAINESRILKEKLKITVWNALKCIDDINTLNDFSDPSRNFSFIGTESSLLESPDLPIDEFGLNFGFKYNPFASSYRYHNFNGLSDAWKFLLQNVWFFWPFKAACIICERPKEIYLTEVNPEPSMNSPLSSGSNIRFHNYDGPAVTFCDGTGIYAVKGHVVSSELVKNPDVVDLETIKKLKTSIDSVVLVELKARKWSAGDDDNFNAVLAAYRLGGVEAALAFMSDGESPTDAGDSPSEKEIDPEQAALEEQMDEAIDNKFQDDFANAQKQLQQDLQALSPEEQALENKMNQALGWK